MSVLYYQDALCVVLLLGAICNSLMGKLWKIMIGEKRPTKSNKTFTSYGMPSSHSNSLFYFVAYLSLYIYEHYEFIYALQICICMVIYTNIICYYRVYRSHDHTIPQIIAGMLHGLVVGTFMYTAVLPRFQIYHIDI